MPGSKVDVLNVHEIRGLCERYLREDVLAAEHVTNVNFEVLKCTLKLTSDAPAGFLGLHQYFTVDVRVCMPHSGVQRIEKLYFFTKSAPMETSRVAYLEQFGVFRKETIVYRDVLPELQRLSAPIAPKCYYENGQLLVFEDLSQRGYRMAAARDGLLNYEHLNCALKTLAVMHAASIEYEQRNGKMLPQLHGEAIAENAYPLNLPSTHVRVQNFDLAVAFFLEIIKTLPQYADSLEIVVDEFPRQMAKIFPLSQTSTQYRNVLLHGDLWANNIMFKYGKLDDAPIDCRFVDFQLVRYAPALLDVLTLLTIPTSRSFRERHMHDLLSDYYRFMTEFLKRAGLSVNEHFMCSVDYWRCATEYRVCGLIESCLFSHLTVLPPEHTQRLTGSTDAFSAFFTQKRSNICMDAFRGDRTYRERMMDMITDIVDNFILNK